LVRPASPRNTNALRSLAAMLWQRPNIGSRVNREVHARFWERAKVKLLRATRHSLPIGHSLTSRDVRNCSKAELSWCCGKFPIERVGETMPAGVRLAASPLNTARPQQLRQLGDVGGDPPSLVASQKEMSPNPGRIVGAHFSSDNARQLVSSEILSLQRGP
jgi:hypothetical protein